jgi:hypothetical protein
MRKVSPGKLLIVTMVVVLVVVLAVLLTGRVWRALDDRAALYALHANTRQLGLKLIIYAESGQGTYPATLADPGFANTLSPDDYRIIQRLKIEYTPPAGKPRESVKLLVGHSRAGTSFFYSDGRVEIKREK